MNLLLTYDGMFDENGNKITLDDIFERCKKQGLNVEIVEGDSTMIKLDRNGLYFENINPCDIITIR